MSLLKPKHNLDESKTKFISKLLGQALNMEWLPEVAAGSEK